MTGGWPQHLSYPKQDRTTANSCLSVPYGVWPSLTRIVAIPQADLARKRCAHRRRELRRRCARYRAERGNRLCWRCFGFSAGTTNRRNDFSSLVPVALTCTADVLSVSAPGRLLLMINAATISAVPRKTLTNTALKPSTRNPLSGQDYYSRPSTSATSTTVCTRREVSRKALERHKSDRCLYLLRDTPPAAASAAGPAWGAAPSGRLRVRVEPAGRPRGKRERYDDVVVDARGEHVR